MDGFYGRILKIDVGTQTFEIEDISDDIYEKYLGGKGLGSYLLYKLNKRKITIKNIGFMARY